MKLTLSTKRKILLIMFQALLFMYYMEALCIPRLYAMSFNEDITSFPLSLRDLPTDRLINAGGILLFMMTTLGSISLPDLLESLFEGDRVGCMSDFGRYNESVREAKA